MHRQTIFIVEASRNTEKVTSMVVILTYLSALILSLRSMI